MQLAEIQLAQALAQQVRGSININLRREQAESVAPLAESRHRRARDANRVAPGAVPTIEIELSLLEVSCLRPEVSLPAKAVGTQPPRVLPNSEGTLAPSKAEELLPRKTPATRRDGDRPQS